ncbi:hypothetical protein [Nocardiopsis sp. CA-288880]|uniref:hypothetical protein n=1 Tax=Nocardiopsis sp. CA-288880 TaxID=3239995 RepID=UPI003D97F621
MWRCYAQRALTDEWLSRDLPLSNLKVTTTLSGPCRVTGSIDPIYRDLIADDGELLLLPWKTWVWVEASDQIRGGGLVTDVKTAGSELDVEITGVTGCLTGQPLLNNLRWGGKEAGTTGNGVDPFDVYRALWTWLQSRAGGNLGVTVDSTSTPYRLGEWHNTRALKEDGSLGPAKEIATTPVPIDKVWVPAKDKKPVAASGKTVYWQYQLNWWDNHELGRVADEMARQTPYDYRERYSWASSAKEAVVKHVPLGYPRLGGRSTKRFAEQENISEVLTIQRSGDDYANLVTAYGAGEGSKMLRANASVTDGRVRRSRTVERPDITSQAALQAVADDELRRWNSVEDILGFTVMDHPNARIGTFDVGDDVLVHAYSGWAPIDLWVRITSMTLSPDTGEVAVTCSRSDRFRYGGAT